VRIIARSTLNAYWQTHHDAKGPLEAWFAEARNAKWKKPDDVKQQYATASIIGDNRVVFNVSGNKYRLVVHVRYDCRIVLVKFIGTHAEYDRINAETV
jgi:mRNA interferase HigB